MNKRLILQMGRLKIFTIEWKSQLSELKFIAFLSKNEKKKNDFFFVANGAVEKLTTE